MNDSRKMVKELSTLILSKLAKNMNATDLYLKIEELQSQIKDLQNKQTATNNHSQEVFPMYQ